MDNLSVSLANYIKQSRIYTQHGDLAGAKAQLLHACECVLLLAKKSTGKEKENYLSTFTALKESIANIDVRIKAQQAPPTPPISPMSPQKNDTPINPTLPTTTPAPAPTLSSATQSAPSLPQGGKGAQTGQFTGSLSPKWLSDYIGQPQAVKAVKDLIDAALLRDSALPHIILYGSHGLGKTTFSKIIANEMHTDFIEVNVTNINSEGMISILKKIKPKDILFIDEIHTLPLQVAESIMYSAMQDGRITYTAGKGKFAHTETLELPPFTLIGATTEIGKIAKPFTQRAIQVRLEEYTDEVLGGIIKASFYKLGMLIDDEHALKISKRCRNNPRIANNTVKRISDKALVRYAAMHNMKDRGVFSSIEEIKKLSISVSDKVIDEFFEENEIDEYGLEKGDRELLKLIVHRYKGGPVGIDTLARAMNESNNVISQKYEAYLIKKGMLRIDKDGRVVMPAGYKAIGEPVPEKLLSEAPKENEQGEGSQHNKYEKRKIIASHIPDCLKCDKIEKLIVYPENVREITQDLAKIFPDVEQPRHEETKHCCELEIDFDSFRRTLRCDSFLESRFATCMASVGFLKDIKAQTLEIPYISQALANRRYFPDFVIRDYKNRVAVIEMKNFNMLTYHLNLDKYEQMRTYCENNGYGYAEIAKEFNGEVYTSLEELRLAPINRQLETYIVETIERKGRETGTGVFTQEDFEAYNQQFGSTPKTELYTILINNRMLKNVDRVGDSIKIELNN